MLCESCKQKEASIHMTQVINQEKTERHLCEECAEKQGLSSSSALSFTDFFQSLLGMTTGFEQDYIGGQQTAASDLQCANCGLTYRKFRQTGKLGCSQCYETFREQLEQIIRSTQANVTHTGKYPAKSGAKIALEREISNLKRELVVAIKDERFEEAANLRDKIRELEKGGTVL